MSDSITVPMDMKTKRFFQGANAANRVLDEHQAVSFPDQASRVVLFWFYVGVLAAAPDEFACTTQEDFASFLLGATTRAPSLDEDDDTSPTLTTLYDDTRPPRQG